MLIEVTGRHTPVNDELREHVERRFRKVDKQVSELARLHVEVTEERNPAITEGVVVEVNLHVKGKVLRATERASDVRRAVNLCEEELARQVKRHREKRRHRRKVGTESIRTRRAPDDGGAASAS